MTWIKKGYCHLLNNSTSELSLSQHHFDLIGGEFGGFLEKSLDKLLKSHDRQIGGFKTNSTFKELMECYYLILDRVVFLYLLLSAHSVDQVQSS